MALGLGLQAPLRVPFTATTRRMSIRANYVPDYSSPDPGSDLAGRYGKEGRLRPNRLPVKNFWEYQAPAASIGSPDGYQLKPVGIPVYSADGGGGGGGGGRGGWGGGGGGGGGSGGDPMKGFTYLFALILFAGGLAAYFKKGSSTSLIVSTGVSVLLLVSASLMPHRVGTLLALAACAGLSGLMGVRAKNSGKLMPAGLVAVLSGLMSVGYVASML